MKNIKNKIWFCQIELTVNEACVDEFIGLKGGFVNALVLADELMDAIKSIYLEVGEMGLTMVSIEEFTEYEKLLKTDRKLHNNIKRLSTELNEKNKVLFDEFQFY